MRECGYKHFGSIVVEGDFGSTNKLSHVFSYKTPHGRYCLWHIGDPIPEPVEQLVPPPSEKGAFLASPLFSCTPGFVSLGWDERQLALEDFQNARFHISPCVPETDFALEYWPDSTQNVKIPYSGITDDAAGRNLVYRVSILNQQDCTYRHSPRENTILGGWPMSWQMARAVHDVFDGFIYRDAVGGANPRVDHPCIDAKAGRQRTEVCLSWLAGLCRGKEDGCPRLHIIFEASNVSATTLAAYGGAALRGIPPVRICGPGPGVRDGPFSPGEAASLRAMVHTHAKRFELFPYMSRDSNAFAIVAEGTISDVALPPFIACRRVQGVQCTGAVCRDRYSNELLPQAPDAPGRYGALLDYAKRANEMAGIVYSVENYEQQLLALSHPTGRVAWNHPLTWAASPEAAASAGEDESDLPDLDGDDAAPVEQERPAGTATADDGALESPPHSDVEDIPAELDLR